MCVIICLFNKYRIYYLVEACAHNLFTPSPFNIFCFDFFFLSSLSLSFFIRTQTQSLPVPFLLPFRSFSVRLSILIAFNTRWYSLNWGFDSLWLVDIFLHIEILMNNSSNPYYHYYCMFDIEIPLRISVDAFVHCPFVGTIEGSHFTQQQQHFRERKKKPQTNK